MPTPRRYASQAERQAAYRRRTAESKARELEAKGLPPLPTIATIPGHPRWQALIRQSNLQLQTVLEEMQDYYDQRSETWQETERGEAFLDRLQSLQEAHSAVEDLAS